VERAQGKNGAGLRNTLLQSVAIPTRARVGGVSRCHPLPTGASWGFPGPVPWRFADDPRGPGPLEPGEAHPAEVMPRQT